MILRVLFLSPVADFKGGAERSLFDLLRNPSIEPLLAVPNLGPLSEAAASEGFRTAVVPYGQVSNVHRPVEFGQALRAIRDWFRAAVRLKSLARSENIDLIHSNGLKAHCIAGLSRLLGAPATIFHIRDIAIRPAEIWIWKILTRFCDHMIVVSRACYPSIELPQNVTVLYNGIKLPPPTEHRSPEGNVIRIGFCGRIHVVKGLDTLLDWLADAKLNGINFKLLIRGEADSRDLAYVELLRSKVASLGLQNEVVFEGKLEGLAAIYKGLDIVVVPSVVPDPLPRSVMEAMAFGLPVVGYPAGGIPDMIQDDQNGWLVASAAEFGRVLTKISTDAEKVAQIRSFARETVQTKFSLDRMYRRLNELYGMVRDLEQPRIGTR